MLDRSASTNIRLMEVLGPREPVPSSSHEWSATDDAAFRGLQEKLLEHCGRRCPRPRWGKSIERSWSTFFLLIVLRQPDSIVIYVTSQPILPRVVDYYFQLVPELNTPDVRQRLFLVSPVDGAPRRLTEKILTRPR